MSYVAIYRKFRPQTFKQVKGQESIVQTLQNQIRNNRIGHAYLFTGTRGTGKTSVARILAKAINCKNPQDGEPCNECENCREISAGNFMDVIEIDAASNTGVDDIRRVIEEVEYSPVSGQYKIYIIDEAHMLSGAAANAFLKTLEEPPAYAVFILATTEPHKLPITILSRCQRYDFKRITTDKIAENIQEFIGSENIEAEEKAVRYIAAAGDGSMRDALSLLDKVVAFNTGGKITYEDALTALGTVDTEAFSKIFRAVNSGDAYTAVKAFDDEIKNGKDISRFVSDFIWYLRNILLISVSGDDDTFMVGLSDESISLLKEDAKLANTETVMRYIRILSELINDMRFSGAKQVLSDVAIIKLARPQMETDGSAILDRIRQIEQKLAGGFKAAPAMTAVPQKKAESKPAPEENIPEAFYSDDEDEDITIDSDSIVFIDTDPGVKETASFSEEEPKEISQETSEGAVTGLPAELVCNRWIDVIHGCDSPLVKATLESAYVKKEDNQTVRIVVQGSVAAERLENRKEKIKELIKNITGCDVGIVITVENEDSEPVNKSSNNASNEEQEIDIDMLIKNNINIEVETEGA